MQNVQGKLTQRDAMAEEMRTDAKVFERKWLKKRECADKIMCLAVIPCPSH
jgi:hypothetical protein